MGAPFLKLSDKQMSQIIQSANAPAHQPMIFIKLFFMSGIFLLFLLSYSDNCVEAVKGKEKASHDGEPEPSRRPSRRLRLAQTGHDEATAAQRSPSSIVHEAATLQSSAQSTIPPQTPQLAPSAQSGAGPVIEAPSSQVAQQSADPPVLMPSLLRNVGQHAAGASSQQTNQTAAIGQAPSEVASHRSGPAETELPKRFQRKHWSEAHWDAARESYKIHKSIHIAARDSGIQRSTLSHNRHRLSTTPDTSRADSQIQVPVSSQVQQPVPLAAEHFHLLESSQIQPIVPLTAPSSQAARRSTDPSILMPPPSLSRSVSSQQHGLTSPISQQTTTGTAMTRPASRRILPNNLRASRATSAEEKQRIYDMINENKTPKEIRAELSQMNGYTVSKIIQQYKKSEEYKEKKGLTNQNTAQPAPSALRPSPDPSAQVALQMSPSALRRSPDASAQVALQMSPSVSRRSPEHSAQIPMPSLSVPRTPETPYLTQSQIQEAMQDFEDMPEVSSSQLAQRAVSLRFDPVITAYNRQRRASIRRIERTRQLASQSQRRTSSRRIERALESKERAAVSQLPAPVFESFNQQIVPLKADDHPDIFQSSSREAEHADFVSQYAEHYGSSSSSDMSQGAMQPHANISVSSLTRTGSTMIRQPNVHPSSQLPHIPQTPSAQWSRSTWSQQLRNTLEGMEDDATSQMPNQTVYDAEAVQHRSADSTVHVPLLAVSQHTPQTPWTPSTLLLPQTPQTPSTQWTPSTFLLPQTPSTQQRSHSTFSQQLRNTLATTMDFEDDATSQLPHQITIAPSTSRQIAPLLPPSSHLAHQGLPHPSTVGAQSSVPLTFAQQTRHSAPNEPFSHLDIGGTLNYVDQVRIGRQLMQNQRDNLIMEMSSITENQYAPTAEVLEMGSRLQELERHIVSMNRTEQSLIERVQQLSQPAGSSSIMPTLRGIVPPSTGIRIDPSAGRWHPSRQFSGVQSSTSHQSFGFQQPSNQVSQHGNNYYSQTADATFDSARAHQSSIRAPSEYRNTGDVTSGQTAGRTPPSEGQ